MEKIDHKKVYVKTGYKSTDLRKVVNNWDDWIKEGKAIAALIKQGCSLQHIGANYGVSRQRMHQIIHKLNAEGLDIQILKYKNSRSPKSAD